MAFEFRSGNAFVLSVNCALDEIRYNTDSSSDYYVDGC